MPSIPRKDRGVQSRRTLLPALLFPLLLLYGCQATAPARETESGAAPARPAAIAENVPRYAVDAQASEIRLLVYRDGPLARFGHNHVILGSVQGEIRAGKRAAASGFHIAIPVASFVVDPPDARAEEGEEFASAVSDQARSATRDNLLGPALLDAANTPQIEVDAIALTGPRWNPTVTGRVKLRGTSRELHFPAAVFEQGDVLTVVANFQIRQSDFGLNPFSTLGGGLRVRDDIEVRMRVIARRAG